MLLVKASAGRSLIHGLGLIAREFIPAGSIVWRFEPTFDVKVTRENFNRLSPIAQEQVIYYAYFDEAAQVFILSSDDDRLTNHSTDPNTKSRDDHTYAVREIHEGEEITSDYREINMVNFKEQ